MKQTSTTKKDLLVLNSENSPAFSCGEQNQNINHLVYPEMKSPSASLVNSILNYSRSLQVTETKKIGKVAVVNN